MKEINRQADIVDYVRELLNTESSNLENLVVEYGNYLVENIINELPLVIKRIPLFQIYKHPNHKNCVYKGEAVRLLISYGVNLYNYAISEEKLCSIEEYVDDLVKLVEKYLEHTEFNLNDVAEPECVYYYTLDGNHYYFEIVKSIKQCFHE